MSNLQVFNDARFGEVRFVEIDGKPHAIGKDIAGALDYKYPADAIRNHCKGSKDHRVLTRGGKQLMKAIPEPDVYRLIVKAAEQSQNLEVKQKAEEFEEWIFEEVLPELRRTGSYQMQEQPKDDLAMIENLNNQIRHVVSHVRKQQEELEEEKKRRQELEQRVESLDAVDLDGDLQQRLNKMVQRYAFSIGGQFSKAWGEFKENFNTAFNTNLGLIQTNEEKRAGEDLTLPEVLNRRDMLEDAIRVANKMLNKAS